MISLKVDPTLFSSKRFTGQECPVYWVVLIALLCLCSPIIYAQTSISGQQDIAELLKSAGETYDLSREDAVILFDGYRVHWQEDGRMKTFVHRIIWINSAPARGRYADHRVPYDNSHQMFRQIIIRTWRDNKWWESTPSAEVITLPSALRLAYDYSNMREVMLLHDGVELPCIVEVAYIIEDSEPFRKGSEGIWLFAKEDPVLLSWFILGIPKGEKPHYFKSEGVAEPKKETDEKAGLDVYTFETEKLPALATPHTVDPAAYTPHVTWSTWKNWDKYGKELRKSFESGMVLNDALRDSLKVVIADAYGLTDKAKKIAGFVKRSTRFIGYAEDYWTWLPRAAHRTYQTAYGHRLDRSILAAALYKEAGFEIFPLYRSRGFGDVNEETSGKKIASRGRMSGVGVWISGGSEVEAYYDPVTSSVHNGLSPIFGRTVWIPGSGDDPKVTWSGASTKSELEIRLTLEYDSLENEWQGHGFYRANQGFTPFDRMEGVNRESRKFLESVLTGILEDAKLTSFNPVTFNRFIVSLGFDFTLPVGDKDHYGRHKLTIGDPASGLFDMLPSDANIQLERRKSPLRLPGMMEQTIGIGVQTKGWEMIHIPDGLSIENDAGKFKLTREIRDDTVVITRELSFPKVDYAAGDWKELRGLLLADKHDRNRTVLLKRVK